MTVSQFIRNFTDNFAVCNLLARGLSSRLIHLDFRLQLGNSLFICVQLQLRGEDVWDFSAVERRRVLDGLRHWLHQGLLHVAVELVLRWHRKPTHFAILQQSEKV